MFLEKKVVRAGWLQNPLKGCIPYTTKVNTSNFALKYLGWEKSWLTQIVNLDKSKRKKRKKRNSWTHHSIGQLLRSSGNLEILSYTKFIKLQPKNVDLVAQLAHIICCKTNSKAKPDLSTFNHIYESYSIFLKHSFKPFCTFTYNSLNCRNYNLDFWKNWNRPPKTSVYVCFTIVVSWYLCCAILYSGSLR